MEKVLMMLLWLLGSSCGGHLLQGILGSYSDWLLDNRLLCYHCHPSSSSSSSWMMPHHQVSPWPTMDFSSPKMPPNDLFFFTTTTTTTTTPSPSPPPTTTTTTTTPAPPTPETEGGLRQRLELEGGEDRTTWPSVVQVYILASRNGGVHANLGQGGFHGRPPNHQGEVEEEDISRSEEEEVTPRGGRLPALITRLIKAWHK